MLSNYNTADIYKNTGNTNKFNTNSSFLTSQEIPIGSIFLQRPSEDM
jgi:phosphatidate phosphatase APP1